MSFIAEPLQCGSKSFLPKYCHNNAICNKRQKYCHCQGNYTGESCDEPKPKCGNEYCKENQFCL